MDPRTYLPPFVTAERDALLMDIETAFGGVTREGGMSWSQSEVEDMYGSPEEFQAARQKDKDERWQDLVDDPSPGIGGWPFLDPVAFRYYLPAAMVRSIRLRYDAGVLFHLMPGSAELLDFTREKWSELDLPQRLCVKRYLEYMFVVSTLRTWCDEDDYIEALEGHWNSPDSGTEASRQERESPRRKKRKPKNP